MIDKYHKGSERKENSSLLTEYITKFHNQVVSAVSDSEDITSETIEEKGLNNFQKGYREEYVKSAQSSPIILECLQIISKTDTTEEALKSIKKYLGEVVPMTHQVTPVLIGLCNILVCNSKEGNQQESDDLQIIWKNIRNYLESHQ